MQVEGYFPMIQMVHHYTTNHYQHHHVILILVKYSTAVMFCFDILHEAKVNYYVKSHSDILM